MIINYIYWSVLAIIGFITMILYFIDKRRAIKNEWRIKEKTLLLSSFLFGSIGGLIGLYGFRHKTKHWYFVVVNVGSFIIHVVIGIVLFINFK